MNNNIKNNIRKERSKKHLTLYEFSQELKNVGINISPDALAKYERGDRDPKIETWEKLANYFGVKASYLMGLDDFRSELKEIVTRMNESNNSLLKNQLARIDNTSLRPLESLALSGAIDLVMTTHDIYFDYEDHDITTELGVIIRGLSRIVKNQSDEYEDIIERFTKLVNLLKEQNKKATDND